MEVGKRAALAVNLRAVSARPNIVEGPEGPAAVKMVTARAVAVERLAPVAPEKMAEAATQ